MKNDENNLIEDAQSFVEEHFRTEVPSKYIFHSIEHICNVVDAAEEIAEGYNLTEEELEILLVAAWFHDTGYSEGPEEHEERSVLIAEDFLSARAYPKDKIKQVKRAIMATKQSIRPAKLIDQILCDADLSHLGNHLYWDFCGKIRQELAVTTGVVQSEKEWIDFELHFMQHHEYNTEVARELYSKLKEKHIRQLKKQRLRLYPEELELELLRKKKKKTERKKKKLEKALSKSQAELKNMPLGRGVETMYRSTYRTHINLSSIADNKANIMLSINAIIISIVISTLVPRFIDQQLLILPTLSLLVVCLLSIIFATLSTRPKVTEGKFSREDIENKNSNLLFFGNYYNMELDDFHWGMMEMIKDTDFLYSSMTRDLYYLGKVLAKKYRFLSICYNIFMYGIIIVVIIFAVVFLISPESSVFTPE